jgi:fucose permease
VKTAPLRTALRDVVRIKSAWILFGLAGVLSGSVVFTGSFLNTFLDSTFHLSSVVGGNYASIFSGSSFIGLLILGYLARSSKTTREFGLATAVGWLLAWIAIAISWFVGGVPMWVVLLFLAICGFCQAASYNFGLNALERGAGIRPELSGVAAGFYFTGSGIGGSVLPPIIAKVVDHVHTSAGLVAPIILLTIGTTLWTATLIPRRRSAGRTHVVPQQATVGQ